MDNDEKRARIAELQHEQTGLALECQRLTDELHTKQTRLISIELQITKLQTEISVLP